MLHLYLRWDRGTEKITSTLTGKLEPDIAAMANILVDGIQKRAAYFAHCKISYVPDGEDYYDQEQYHKEHPSSEGKRFRRKKSNDC